MKRLIFYIFVISMLGCASQKFIEEYVIYEIINEKTVNNGQ